MKLKITTLSENTAGLGGFMGEWGLSILVEAGDLNLLLDAGQSTSAVHNADILGVDLSRVEKIVLSHGHYDHTGGLCPILRRMKKRVEVIAHPEVWAAKYARRKSRHTRYIGIPYQRQELESLGADFKLTAESSTITPNIMTSGEIPMVTEYEKIEPYLLVKDTAGLQPDELLDDRALIINTETGLVVILGCAHRGVINTLYYAQQLTGVKRIYAVLGGCHLMDASEERIRLTIDALKELGIQKMGVSHCTGLAAASLMAYEFGGRFFFNNAGTTISLS
jgi:7,8-dihydropterin-6-yl-methyl-4-(beta-D-ribofuranosyl)aminobenzene 5'-phosphate synthase